MKKRIIAILMVMIFSINTFGAIVSDNDGSAFVTKEEFDALKKDFAGQIKNYESSIDEKIDGAIAAYLAGIKLSETIVLDDLVSKFSSTNKYSTMFVNKSEKIDGSNNAKFTRGGWWFFYVFGWNIADGMRYHGVTNVASYNYSWHTLRLYPDIVDSRKWFLEKYTMDDADIYGPYDDKLMSLEQKISAMKVESAWNVHTVFNASQIVTSGKTFDFTALSAPGSTTVGTNPSGWNTWSGIDGKIEIEYKEKENNKKQWAIMNATGKCNDEDTNKNYGVEYLKRFDIAKYGTYGDSTKPTNIQEEGARFRNQPGGQWQEFNPNTRQWIAGADRSGVQLHTFRFTTPTIIELKNSELHNVVTSKTVAKPVPMYAGLPVTSVSQNGSVKINFKINTYALSNDKSTNEKVWVAFKASQFQNKDIYYESDLLWSKSVDSNSNQTCNFELSDIKKGNNTYIYAKVMPTSTYSYAQFINVDNPTLITKD